MLPKEFIFDYVCNSDYRVLKSGGQSVLHDNFQHRKIKAYLFRGQAVYVLRAHKMRETDNRTDELREYRGKRRAFNPHSEYGYENDIENDVYKG